MNRLIAATLMFVISAQAFADGSSFLKISPSARSYALGASQAVTAMGAESLGSNPANLGLLERRYEVFSTYETLVDGAQYTHIAGVYEQGPHSAIEAFGLSLTRLQTNGIQGADASGTLTGDNFGTSDTAFTAATSMKLNEEMHAGLAIKGVKSSIGSYRSNMAVAGDIGINWRNEKLMAIASLQNFGQGQKFNTVTDKLPTTVHVGVAAPFYSTMGVFEVNRGLNDSRTGVGIGFEYVISSIALRLGYAAQFGIDKNLAQADQTGASKNVTGLTAGIGFRLGPVKFDYALSQQAVDYGPAHRISLSVQWGDKSLARRRAMRKPKLEKSEGSEHGDGENKRDALWIDPLFIR